MTGDALVSDAAALIDLLAGSKLAEAVALRIGTAPPHAPGHLDAEVLSALGRSYRAGTIKAKLAEQLTATLITTDQVLGRAAAIARVVH